MDIRCAKAQSGALDLGSHRSRHQFQASHSARWYADNNGSVRQVCLTTDARLQYAKMPRARKLLHVVALLKRMYNRGLVSGGLSPDDVVFDGDRTKVKNPALLQAMNDSDSILYEAVATLAMQNRDRKITRKSMGRIADALISSSVLARHYITEELRRRGSKVPPSEAGADLAMKYSGVL